MKEAGRNWLYRDNVRDFFIALALASAFFNPQEHFLVQSVVALVLLALGTVLHITTKATLVRNRVPCNSGVYRLCRHPYYLANFIVDISLCLLSGNVYLVLACPFFFFWAYGPALRFEEEKMAGIHGDAYHEYLLQTPQIFLSAGNPVTLKEIFQEVSPARVSRKEWIRILRFWLVALALIFIHDVARTGVKSLYVPPINLDAMIIAGLMAVILILVITLSLLKRSRLPV